MRLREPTVLRTWAPRPLAHVCPSTPPPLGLISRQQTPLGLTQADTHPASGPLHLLPACAVQAPDAHRAQSLLSLTARLKSHFCSLVTPLKCQPPPSSDIASSTTQLSPLHSGDASVHLLTCVCTARPSPQGRRGEGMSTDFALCFHHQYPEWCLHAKMRCPHLGSHAVLARLTADASQGLTPAHKSHPGTAPPTAQDPPATSSRPHNPHEASLSFPADPSLHRLSAHEHSAHRTHGHTVSPLRPARAWPLTSHASCQNRPLWHWGLAQGFGTTLPRSCPLRGL